MATRPITGVGESRSIGEIIDNVVHDVGDIVRSEIRLARVEMTEKARKAGKAGGLLAAAGVMGFLAAEALVACIIMVLSLAIPVWAAALATTFLLGGIAAALFVGGRERLRRVSPVPEQTVQTIKENVRWTKRQIS